jgi:hypothetical protein
MALFIEIKRMQSVSPVEGTLLRRYNGNCELLTFWDFADSKEQAHPPNKFNRPGDVVREWDDSIESYRYFERID